MNELKSGQIKNTLPIITRKKLTLGKSHGGHLGVDGVENALIANLGLGDEADLRAQVRNSSAGARHDH